MKIKINGLKTDIIVGCFLYEQQAPQPVILNIEYELIDNVDFLQNDQLINTVCYDTFVDFVYLELQNSKFLLLETLLQSLANNILKKFELIKTISLSICKHNLIDKKVGYIEVAYQKQREYSVALALGSNTNYMPKQQIINAIEMLGEFITAIKIGGFYLTSPMYETKQNNFINSAIVGKTTLSIKELLAKIKIIETLLGKKELQINGARIIDIDIIFFDKQIIKDNFLSIPHQDMHNRDFVLAPLVEIAPEWLHPELNVSVAKLSAQVNKLSIIKRLGDYKKDY